MKKVISILFCSLFVLGLVGCSNNLGSSSANTLSSSALASPESTKETAFVSEDSPVSTVSPNSNITDNIHPLEIRESGYFLVKYTSQFFIQYAIVITNPNEDIAINHPEFRITARDSDNSILATEEGMLLSIGPGETLHYAFLGPSVDIEPSEVNFEIIPSTENNWVLPNTLEYSDCLPLELENLRQGSSNITGEINNKNDIAFPNAIVTVIFKDEDGQLVGGDSTFVSSVSAKAKTPFEVTISYRSQDMMTPNYEVFVYPWS